MHAIPELDLFSRADAMALGWTDSALGRAVRSGRLVRVRRGYFTSVQPHAVQRAVAAARTCTGSVVSHRSAALIHGLPLLCKLDFRPDLTLSPPSTGDTVAALVHRATLRAHDIVVIDAVPVTSVPRTLVDLGRSCPITHAVAAIDHALHERLATRGDIADVLDLCRNWPGIRRAVRALDLADGRTESPLESLSRLAIGRLGLPAPEPQVTIVDDRGVAVGRLDFYWDGAGCGGEADGRSKYDGRDVLSAEKERQEALEDLGVAMTRWTWAHATRNMGVMRSKILRCFERGAARDAGGLPRKWSVRPSDTAK